MARTDDDDECMLGGPLRARQEQQVELSHKLTDAEFALAREACALGRTFEQAGLAFDPLTFVVLRIVEGSLAERADPVDCLRTLDFMGLFDRSVAMAVELMDEAA